MTAMTPFGRRPPRIREKETHACGGDSNAPRVLHSRIGDASNFVAIYRERCLITFPFSKLVNGYSCIIYFNEYLCTITYPC